MDFSTILKHMNEHHQADMIALCKKFGGASDVKQVTLEGVDFGGLDLVYDGQKLRVDFPQKADMSTIKQAIIDICMGASRGGASGGANEGDAQLMSEIKAFQKELASCILATLTPDGFPLSSYAPIIQMGEKNYIYISATAEHFANIKQNPQKIEVMFIEDECKAKTILARKRLRYQAHARFVERGCEEFEKTLDFLESTMDANSGIKAIRNFPDFHLIELQFKTGRFVKGFGQAYLLTENGTIQHLGGNGGNPHENPHNNPHANPHANPHMHGHPHK